jgi:hypothetical protein
MNSEEFERKMDQLQAALTKMQEERKRAEAVPFSEKKIATYHDVEPGGPPWTAVYPGRDNPFDGDPIGLGDTEAEAIADLKSQVQ